jgi:D-alanyl-D-alanine carboxypeptidase
MVHRRFFTVSIAAAVLIGGVAPLPLVADTINPPLPDVSADSPKSALAISISRPMGISASVRNAIVDVAESIGAKAHPGRVVTLGMTKVQRGPRAIQRVRKGLRVPMLVVAHHDEVVRALMGNDLADVVESGSIAMGFSSARLRGAREGDVVTLLNRRSKPRQFVIGAIVEDEMIGGADILMSLSQASAMGARITTRYTLIGFTKPAVAARAVADAGFVSGLTYRVRATWDPPNPDATLGLGEAKALLGEFAYAIDKNGKVTADPGWTPRNITPRRNFSGIPVRAACHRKVWSAIQGALFEIQRAGWSRLIDVDNANEFGGCHYARLNRIGEELGVLSRHSWGMAFDFNTTTNSQGRPPNMPCGIVRIFRKWGFAWGGNFTPADGMHFEYVGERRDNIAFPSRYCPNIVGGDG